MHHEESSRLIFSANQLNGFYNDGALVLNGLKVNKEQLLKPVLRGS